MTTGRTTNSVPFNDQIAPVVDSIAEVYRDLHRHPELSMAEHRTAATITEALAALGLAPQSVGGTGVVVVVENGAGPVIGYRADIDGLPMKEETGLSYASEAKGVLPDGSETDVMHGCGHDTHAAVGLGLARYLVENRDNWAGSVVLIFQPGEETGAGAKAMIDGGLWDMVPKPSLIYGQHVAPAPAGTIMLARGLAMSTASSVHVTVHGKQAHASQPHYSIDPVVLSAYMITRLQAVVSREVSGADLAVVTVSNLHGGLKENIIPQMAEFSVNVRAFDPDVLNVVIAAVERIIRAEAMASAAPEPAIEPLSSFPLCYNDLELVDELVDDLHSEFDEDQIIVIDPAAASEDFGWFGQSIGVPYVYWYFGGFSEEAYRDGKTPFANHHPGFAPDDVEACLSTGLRAAVAAVKGQLST